jgi:hypothetical protein
VGAVALVRHDAPAHLGTGQTWWDLQTALDQDHWHIFHFIGHGDFDIQTGEGVLALSGEDGGVHRLAATDLALLLAEQQCCGWSC